MRNRLLMLLALLAAAFAAVTLSACGSDDSGGGNTVKLDLKKVAEATKAKGSAEISLKFSGKDDKQSADFSLTGKADFDKGKLDAEADLGSVLAAAGVPAQGDQSVRLLVDGKKIWIKIPSVQGLTLPGGQDWASLDLEKVSDKFDIKKQADKARSEPIEPIEMNKVGTETLNGEEVTHLKSESTLRDLLGSLSEEQSKQAIEQIEKQDGGKKALDTKVPVEVWVDSSNALHRMTAEISDGETDVAVDLTMKNFGAAVTIDPPAASETFDATELLLQAAGSLGSLGSTP